MPLHLEAHADDSVGRKLARFLFHARHRQFARVVERLGQDGHLFIPRPAAALVTHVINRRAHDEARGLEAGLLHQEKFVHR